MKIPLWGLIGIFVAGLITAGTIMAVSPFVLKASPQTTITSTPDTEKTFLQTFASSSITQYQKIDFNDGYIFLDGQGYYNVVCMSNGTWVIISRMQLPAPAPTATSTP